MKKYKNLFLVLALSLILVFSVPVSSLTNQLTGNPITKPIITPARGETTIPICKSGQEIGDVNGDGKIDKEDSNIILQIVTGKIPPPKDICCADVSKDKKISGYDSNLILQIISGRKSSPGTCSFPIEYPSIRKKDKVELGKSVIEGAEEIFTIVKTDDYVEELKIDKGLTVETSLTSSEDDYQTDVVLEVAKDSIKYQLRFNKPVTKEMFLKLTGYGFSVVSIERDNKFTISRNGIQETYSDGDAFINDNQDDPDWVWNLENLNSNNAIIGIENDFVINDDSDNPPKVGECIKLPNNYASICLDKLTVQTNEYSPYTIEYDDSTDLSDAGAGTSEKTIHIYTTNNKGIKLESGINTKEIWITGDKKVYYKNLNSNKVVYLGNGNINAEINKDLSLVSVLKPDKIDININSNENLKETLTATFGVSNNKVYALGNSNSLEEPNELIWGIYGNELINIGTKDEDHLTSYGIIIRNPKSHGASDEVVLEIPPKQVFAQVSVNIPPYKESPIQKEKTCNYNTDCFLNTGETAVIDGNKIKLVRVGSAHAIIVEIEAKITETISSNTANGLLVRNKETFYDPNNPENSAATIVVTKS